MKSADEMKTYCLVVGGGALGVLLADALSQSQRTHSDSTHVLLFNRSPLPKNVVIQCESNGEHHELDVPILSGSMTDCVQKLRNLAVSRIIVFLCAPPEETEKVFNQWLNEFSATNTNFVVHFVFCNNGLLSPFILKKTLDLNPQFLFYRAIFFTGSVRVIENDICRVLWKGGELVRWGALNKASLSESESLKQCLAERTQAGNVDQNRGHFMNVGFLRWQFESDIQKVEREKFFTNFMIAAFIGPRKKKNMSLFQETTEDFRKTIASQFALLWPDNAVTRESLLENLNTTVMATGENYNSLSLQGFSGSRSTFDYFMQIIERDVAQHSNQHQLKELVEFMNTAKIIWGVGA